MFMTETRHPAGGEPRGRREASPSIRALDAREALIETPNRFEDLIADPLSEDNAAAVGDHASFVAAAFTFGDFQLQPRDRVLLEDDNPVRLGGRALDVLILLVERAGEVVSKEEIFARVWP